MKPIEISDETFGQEVIQAPNLTIVDFWAPWCGPCKLMAPLLDEIARDYDGQVKVVKLNVDENTASATHLPFAVFLRFCSSAAAKLWTNLSGQFPAASSRRVFDGFSIPLREGRNNR